MKKKFTEEQIVKILKQQESTATPTKESIARAKFRILRKTVYPDALLHCRLLFGTVKGYR